MRPQGAILLLSLAYTSAFGLSSLQPLRTCFGTVRQASNPFRMSTAHPDATAGGAPMNFAAISCKDENVFGIHRPGFLPDGVNEKPGAVEDALVTEWCSFIKGKGVTRILSLLEDDEAAWFKTPIEKQLEAEGFSEAKGTYIRTPLSSPDSAKKALEALTSATASGDKIVLHCSGGIGRTGLMSAVYLAKQYGMTPEEAVKEVTSQAQKAGVSRATKAEKVTATMEKL
mmetsp:Transcript_10027/g.24262  ORF Transcript_10027/g.24262 Transcript_10027/m.24262 type:complete len:228 (+) Transcript_10027:63-746(+)